MPIKIHSFGGIMIWELRKYHSQLTSKISLTVAGRFRKAKINAYIGKFLDAADPPCFRFLMLETLNRCNGKCEFCPANVNVEKREYKKMSDELFHKIINDLIEMKWTGSIFLQVNNEPLIDTRILTFASEIRNKLSGVYICIITNGTLLSIDKVREMVPLVDELIINDYSTKYALDSHLKEIYKYVKKNKVTFKNIDISINRRYNGEILATRAGTAPNKPKKNNHITFPCIYPFTDMIIFPDGKVGMCCNDCFEVTDFGDANKESLLKIWKNDRFGRLREKMRNGRNCCKFCKECDVVDAGSREKEISIEG